MHIAFVKALVCLARPKVSRELLRVVLLGDARSPLETFSLRQGSPSLRGGLRTQSLLAQKHTCMDAPVHTERACVTAHMHAHMHAACWLQGALYIQRVDTNAHICMHITFVKALVCLARPKVSRELLRVVLLGDARSLLETFSLRQGSPSLRGGLCTQSLHARKRTCTHAPVHTERACVTAHMHARMHAACWLQGTLYIQRVDTNAHICMHIAFVKTRDVCKN